MLSGSFNLEHDPAPYSFVFTMQMLALEAANKDLEAKLLHEHQQDEAAAAHCEELLAQYQAVTQDCDIKCACAVNEADLKISALHVGLQLHSQASLHIKWPERCPTLMIRTG